jgi:hypothetical protein
MQILCLLHSSTQAVFSGNWFTLLHGSASALTMLGMVVLLLGKKQQNSNSDT